MDGGWFGSVLGSVVGEGSWDGNACSPATSRARNDRQSTSINGFSSSRDEGDGEFD